MCSPTSGPGRTAGRAVPRTRIGVPTAAITRPDLGIRTSTNAPRARSCGSRCGSSPSSTGARQTSWRAGEVGPLVARARGEDRLELRARPAAALLHLPLGELGPARRRRRRRRRTWARARRGRRTSRPSSGRRRSRTTPPSRSSAPRAIGVPRDHAIPSGSASIASAPSVIETSTCAPSPVRARPTSAASTPAAAGHEPPATSATCTPIGAGRSGVPFAASTPANAR